MSSDVFAVFEIQDLKPFYVLRDALCDCANESMRDGPPQALLYLQASLRATYAVGVKNQLSVGDFVSSAEAWFARLDTICRASERARGQREQDDGEPLRLAHSSILRAVANGDISFDLIRYSESAQLTALAVCVLVLKGYTPNDLTIWDRKHSDALHAEVEKCRSWMLASGLGGAFEHDTQVRDYRVGELPSTTAGSASAPPAGAVSERSRKAADSARNPLSIITELYKDRAFLLTIHSTQRELYEMAWRDEVARPLATWLDPNDRIVSADRLIGGGLVAPANHVAVMDLRPILNRKTFDPRTAPLTAMIQLVYYGHAERNAEV